MLAQPAQLRQLLVAQPSEEVHAREGVDDVGELLGRER